MGDSGLAGSPRNPHNCPERGGFEHQPGPQGTGHKTNPLIPSHPPQWGGGISLKGLKLQLSDAEQAGAGGDEG